MNNQEQDKAVNLLKEATGTIKQLKKRNYEQGVRLQMFDDMMELSRVNKRSQIMQSTEQPIENNIDNFLDRLFEPKSGDGA